MIVEGITLNPRVTYSFNDFQGIGLGITFPGMMVKLYEIFARRESVRFLQVAERIRIQPL